MEIKRFKRSTGEKKYSILIPTWNNLPYLKLCIDSIRRNSGFDHQIIVHINEGIDGTREYMESQPDIDYTLSEQNIGVCYALNVGRTMMTTDYLVYVNDDMYLCPGWDTELDKEIRSIGNNAFFLSATAIEPIASSDCVIEKDFGTDIQSFREDELLKQYNVPSKNNWQGATWPPNIVHKETWDLVGGYSVEFSPGMYSDPDFSMKLWLAGIRLFKGVSASRAYHFGSKSTQRVVKNKGYYTFISKWGYTSSFLTKHLLRRGEKFDGPLRDVEAGKMMKLKNFFKRLDVLFRPTM